MSRPTKAELAKALTEATRMREQGDDPHFLAKALLSHQYRLIQLERVVEQLENYLHSGQDVSEHARLARTLERYHSLERRTAGVEEQVFGLD